MGNQTQGAFEGTEQLDFPGSLAKEAVGPNEGYVMAGKLPH